MTGLDTLRFPLNKTGLAHIALFTFFIFTLLLFEFVLSEIFGPFAVYIRWGLALINLSIGLEIIHYLYLCTQESAQGALTAPDNLFADTINPEKWSDLLQEYVFRVSPVVLCFVPSVLYNAFCQRVDWGFFLLLGAGCFYFPVFYLAVAMFNSPTSFNPYIHIISIVKTFFSYGRLVLQIATVVALFIVLAAIFQHNWLTSLLLFPVLLYYMIIIAHLIGRFYCHHGHVLNWEV